MRRKKNIEKSLENFTNTHTKYKNGDFPNTQKNLKNIVKMKNQTHFFNF